MYHILCFHYFTYLVKCSIWAEIHPEICFKIMYLIWPFMLMFFKVVFLYLHSQLILSPHTHSWHWLWLWVPSVSCLLHNKVTKEEEMAIGRNKAGQQMSFGHLSPGPWLSEVMSCVCAHQSQGHLPERELKRLLFLSLLLQETCTGRR